ncbi:helix-turn-helix domain-containing protein [Nocardioides insulae]|uniref:helix-turn-helix domain-containing protein n=1 Tax=Nocardioides insulae TaxID=394734 RepID=UPI00048F9800|nr:helix-turn-helix domain-containing protein [Nocardioides insulae]
MTADRQSLLPVIARSLRTHRERVGLSQAELARRADISKSTLSQLEAGAGNPSVETIWALSVALDVPFADLVEPAQAPATVIRRNEGVAVVSDVASFQATVLSAAPPQVRRDLYRIVASPGSVRESDPHMPGVVEHVVIGVGRARVGPAAAPVELGPGDYITYSGAEPHVFEALEPETTAVLISEHRGGR